MAMPLRRLPKVWNLPFGARVNIKYKKKIDGAYGMWFGFKWKRDRFVGEIWIAEDTIDEMLYTLYHEMQHALIDWHGLLIRDAQREYMREVVETVAELAKEEAE